MEGRSFALRLVLGFCLTLVLQRQASCLAQQNDSNPGAPEANPGCTRLKEFPELPMAVVESCQTGDSVGITLPLKPDSNGLAQEKTVRGQYEFREYRVPQSDEDHAFANLMTLVPIAGFTVQYSVDPSLITARNGDIWMLIHVVGESYNVSIVRTTSRPWIPVKTAEEISKKFQADNRVDIYGIAFAPGNEAILEKQSEILFEILKFLKQNPDLDVVIEGHKMSTRGSAEDDLEISRERANAVFDWLVAHGIAARRLQSRPFGHRNPLTENENPIAIQQNERIVLAKATN